MKKYNLSKIMKMAWQFVKRNGFSISQALITAWKNAKTSRKMRMGIAHFWFRKINGEIREAFGTLKDGIVPQTNGNHRDNPTLQTYYDTERQDWRCYKIANIVAVE